MLMSRRWTVKVWILSLYCMCWKPSEACSSARASDIKVYVIGKRDWTGQYVSTVELLLGAENGRDSYNWTVNLDEYSGSCDGITFSQILVDVAVPANPDYELFPGVGYYKFHTAAKKWVEGKKVCEDEGAHLAIINSEQELTVLNLMYQRNKYNIINAHRNEVVGVGFHDMYMEGEYVTIFGEPLASTGFFRWSQRPIHQPNNYHGSATHPGEDCGSILAGTDGLLDDISCDNANIAFVCEQELARPISVNNVCIN